MIQFNIDSWRAWAPELARPNDWAHRSKTDRERLSSTGEQPDVSFLPAMQRRRLSRLARMVFHAAWPLAEGQPPLPFVYVSRHGETSRTFSILNDLARDEPLSPTQFSLSVHNAVIGLWSILRADNSEMTALACEGDGLQYGALEAEALLAEGAPAVLLVVAEEQPDAVYDDWIDDVPFSYATAFRLCKGRDWTLSRQTHTTHDEPYPWPHALNLIQVLSSQSSFCQNQGKGHLWTWQRNA